MTGLPLLLLALLLSLLLLPMLLLRLPRLAAQLPLLLIRYWCHPLSLWGDEWERTGSQRGGQRPTAAQSLTVRSSSSCTHC